MTVSEPRPVNDLPTRPGRSGSADLLDAPEPSPAVVPPAMRHAPPETAKKAGGLGYLPALDGLRAVAVLAVLFFHGGFTWAVGGYLGVSTFFTLSGFLITSLLLAERTRSSTISLRGFWGRRLRRLMPASLTALALVLLFGALGATPAQQRNLGAGVTSALFDITNWYFIFSHTSYADLFSAPSPVLHYWSLAIEEQFYLLFPLLAFVLLARIGLKRRGFGGVLVGLMAASLAATLFLGYNHDRIYFGTDTRAFELLAGCLLAVVVSGRHRINETLHRPGPVRTVVAGVGVVGLTAMLYLFATTPQSSNWLYKGGLSAYSLLSVAAILAATLTVGPVARALSARPLVALGLISYGVYLYHWPVFLWIDGAHTGLSIWPLFIVRVSVTLILALASYRLIERPIRMKRITINRRTPLLAAPFVMVCIGLTAWLITTNAPGPLFDVNIAERALSNLDNNPPPAHKDLTPADAARAPRVAIFGDSTAVAVGAGIADVDQQKGLVQEVSGAAFPGCGLGRGGESRSLADGSIINRNPECDQWTDTFRAALDKSQPDLAVVLFAPWDVVDRKIPGDDQWRSFGDPVYDAWFNNEMLDAVDVLSSEGATVVWLTSPPVNKKAPDRTDRLNQLIKGLPAQRPGKVVVIDLGTNLTNRPNFDTMRADNVHLTPSASDLVANDFLIPKLSAIWKQITAGAGTTTTTAAGATTTSTTRPN